MKVPLGYQISEYDCGVISLYNAFSYLLNREEMDGKIVKAINEYTLDGLDGNRTGCGTSREAMKGFVNWCNDYAKDNNLDIVCEYYDGPIIDLKLIEKCIKKGAVIVVRLWQSFEHYVIVTKLLEDEIYIFDPYYVSDILNDSEVKFIFDDPFKYNRIVSFNRFFSETKKDFSLGHINNREIVVIYKN